MSLSTYPPGLIKASIASLKRKAMHFFECISHIRRFEITDREFKTVKSEMATHYDIADQLSLRDPYFMFT